MNLQLTWDLGGMVKRLTSHGFAHLCSKIVYDEHQLGGARRRHSSFVPTLFPNSFFVPHLFRSISVPILFLVKKGLLTTLFNQTHVICCPAVKSFISPQPNSQPQLWQIIYIDRCRREGGREGRMEVQLVFRMALIYQGGIL